MAKIYWAGQSCFQISVSNSRDHSADIVIDPFDGDKLGIKMPNLSADIALVTHDHYDHNNTGALKGEPFVISGPGEYEVKGVFVQGIPSFHDDEAGKTQAATRPERASGGLHFRHPFKTLARRFTPRAASAPAFRRECARFRQGR